jgi:hypothetical protein
VKAYVCVRCQQHHCERDGLIFREHLGHQSKHGIYHLSERDWALVKLVHRDRAARGEPT